MDLVTIIGLVRAAADAAVAVRNLAAEAAATMGKDDAEALAKEMARLAAENDAGHAVFQAKLAEAAQR